MRRTALTSALTVFALARCIAFRLRLTIGLDCTKLMTSRLEPQMPFGVLRADSLKYATAFSNNILLSLLTTLKSFTMIPLCETHA